MKCARRRVSPPPARRLSPSRAYRDEYAPQHHSQLVLFFLPLPTLSMAHGSTRRSVSPPPARRHSPSRDEYRQRRRSPSPPPQHHTPPHHAPTGVQHHPASGTNHGPPGSQHNVSFPMHQHAPLPKNFGPPHYQGEEFKHKQKMRNQHDVHYSNCSGGRKAVVIGINYSDSASPLSGCHNDASASSSATYLEIKKLAT